MTCMINGLSVMAYIVMAYTVTAYIVTAYIVVAQLLTQDELKAVSGKIIQTVEVAEKYGLTDLDSRP